MSNFVRIAWYGKHFGEEPPLVGLNTQGAGTIFFTGCNLRCLYCQNYQISQQGIGKTYSLSSLVNIMLELQSLGCATIDLVSPTVWFNILLKAIPLAKEKGLTLPIVWNSNGYESIEMIKQLNGLVDIYLPDFKYSNNVLAKELSGIYNYHQITLTAIKEMLGQVGIFDQEDIAARKGLIIRHLVLPGQLENTFGVLQDIVDLDKNIPVSLMGQYYPVYKAVDKPPFNQRLSNEEFDQAQQKMFDLGLLSGWTQSLDSGPVWLPDFTKELPFERV